MRDGLLRDSLVRCSLLLAVAAPAAAQQSRQADVQRQLAERDARIAELQWQLQQVMQRLDALEHGAAPQAPPAPKAVAAAPAPAAVPNPTPAAPASPSQYSEEEVGRALESTLVRRRALVLPPGAVQVTPEVSYSHQRTSSTVFFAVPAGLAVAQQDVRTDTVGGDVAFRLGLPWDSQAEVDVPLGYVRQRTVTGGVPRAADTTGFGDVQLAFSKELMSEREWLPGLLGTVEWKSKSGKTPAPTPAATTVTSTTSFANVPALSLGTGFDAFAAGLSASKRQDPLVFFGSAAYAASLPGRQGGVQVSPGDTLGFAVGAALAASPTASLSADFNIAFASDAKANGVKIAGSDQVVGIFEIGAATSLTPRLVLDVGLGFGVTQNAPNFILSLSLPYRF